MPVAMLNRGTRKPHNGGVDDEVKALLDQLDALGKSVRRHEAAAEKDRAAIRKLLPEARAKEIGPADLERAIHGVYVQGTISRWTKHVILGGDPPQES